MVFYLLFRQERHLSPIKRAIRKEGSLDTYNISLPRFRPRFNNPFWIRREKVWVKGPDFLHVWSRKPREFFKCSPANVNLKKIKAHPERSQRVYKVIMCRTSWGLSAERLYRALLPFNHLICRNGCAPICYHGPWCPVGMLHHLTSTTIIKEEVTGTLRGRYMHLF